MVAFFFLEERGVEMGRVVVLGEMWDVLMMDLIFGDDGWYFCLR